MFENDTTGGWIPAFFGAVVVCAGMRRYAPVCAGMRRYAPVCAGMGLTAGFVSTADPVDNRFHDAAVEAGHAEYYLDEHHERQWRWLPPNTTTKVEPTKPEKERR